VSRDLGVPELVHQGGYVSVTGVVFLALLCMPWAGVLVWAAARLRQLAGAGRRWAWRASAAEVGIVWGTVPAVWLTMVPGPGVGTDPGAVSLEPFTDLHTMSTVQVVGNLLLFAALGFLAPVRFRALASVPRVTALAAACSGLVEVLQHVLVLDRVSSVDDIILNTVGAAVASCLSWPWHAGRRWGSRDVDGGEPWRTRQGPVTVGQGALSLVGARLEGTTPDHVQHGDRDDHDSSTCRPAPTPRGTARRAG
jgi:hypothetical protein